MINLAATSRMVEADSLLYGEYVTMSRRLVIAMRAWQEKLKAGQ